MIPTDPQKLVAMRDYRPIPDCNFVLSLPSLPLARSQEQNFKRKAIVRKVMLVA